MRRGRFAQIVWEQRGSRQAPGGAEALAAAPAALAAVLERTGVPRHPRGDAVPVREETEFLLQCAAEVEHQFIVQYLYAAYSLDPARPDAPPETADWRDNLIQIAREEMGHLITVQNLLLCLGAQPYLERQSSPPPAPLPFPLQLEPFSESFVARFLVAESPADPSMLPEELRHLKETIDHVGVLYAMLYWLFQESDTRVCPWLLPEGFDFPPGRHLAVADFADPAELADRINQPDEWRGNSRIRVLPDTGQTPLTTRQQIADAARRAIFEVAAQGEGPNDLQDDPDPCPPLSLTDSHFGQLREIFDQLRQAQAAGIPLPVRPVPTAPQVSQFTHPVANRLARAADLRYELLMLEIAIAVFTRRSLTANGEIVLEQIAGFALNDMNPGIRRMAGRLVTLPRTLAGTAGVAAPPFSLPAVPFPGNERGRWRRLIELLDAFGALLAEPAGASDPVVEQILTGAAGADPDRRQLAESVLAQLP